MTSGFVKPWENPVRACRRPGVVQRAVQQGSWMTQDGVGCGHGLMRRGRDELAMFAMGRKMRIHVQVA